MHRQVGIIGSGIAGLMCAQTLQSAGVSCFVLDKGRGPGGRMATRFRGDYKWDHGAQYFTVKEDRFQSLVAQWEALGIVQPWFDLKGSRQMGDTRYVGRGGMHSIPKYLGQSLDVYQSTRVDRLFRIDNTWHLEAEKGAIYRCEECVCTQPIPQAVQLLKDSKVWDSLKGAEALESVEYEKGLSTLVVLSGNSLIPEPGCVKVKEGILTWIADNSKKGLEASPTCLTLQADPSFAKAYWDRPDSERGALMIEAASEFWSSEVEVLDFHCHRWGYAFAKNPLNCSHYREAAKSLSVAGDGFMQSRIESALLSGISAAEAIIQSIN